jgi:hypothetical protein
LGKGGPAFRAFLRTVEQLGSRIRRRAFPISTVTRRTSLPLPLIVDLVSGDDLSFQTDRIGGKREINVVHGHVELLGNADAYAALHVDVVMGSFHEIAKAERSTILWCRNRSPVPVKDRSKLMWSREVWTSKRGTDRVRKSCRPPAVPASIWTGPRGAEILGLSKSSDNPACEVL